MTRGGVNGSRSKFLAIESSAYGPKFTTNPRVLGEMQSSYRGATLTQSSPRNKQDRPWKQPRRAAQKKQHGITHRLIRRLSLNGVGSTDEQSRQQSKRAPVEPMKRLQRASVEPVIEHRMIQQNQAQMSVQLSRETAKTM